MTLHNASNFKAGYNLGLEKSGHHCMVVVAKATYTLPQNKDEVPTLLDEDKQVKIYPADVYTGEPGESAILYENDFAPFKPKCDVILNGSAYAYPDKEVTECIVQLKVADIDKSFKVIGKRVWEKHGSDLSISEPTPFSTQVISLDVAYGGYDFDPEKPSQDDENYVAFDANPVGQGFAPYHDDENLEGKLLAQTQEIEVSATDTQGKETYIPQSFGVMPRHTYPRYTLGGTYDKHWAEEISPFLPDDFDEAYYQSVGEEQQMAYVEGGEKVYLKGLTLQGESSFTLPTQEVSMEVIRSNGNREVLSPVVDTLIIEPDEKRFTMLSRAKITLKRSIHEVDTIIVGTPDALWEKKRLYGECYEEEKEEILEITEGTDG